jgi:hypothetical protein
MKPEVVDTTRKVYDRILRAHALERIELSVTPKNVWARAIPNGFHPMVTTRREAAYAAAVAQRCGSISLSEAQAINAEALAAVARARGDDSLSALLALEIALRGAV